VFTAMNDVAGESAKADRELSTKVEKSAYNCQEATEDKESAAEFAKRIHNRILPQAASKSFWVASVIQ
jgi:hypothetical protein